MGTPDDLLYVDTGPALDALCRDLAPAPWLAVDTEFVRERTYYPVFCLLQVSDGTRTALVDTLAIADLDPLRDLLYAPARTLVLHSASQDLELFVHRWQGLPPRVFDTQIAATAAGLGDQLGYAALVKALLGVDLEKSQTRTDWSRRPLSGEQLHYAAADVVHLAALYPALVARLEDQGRRAWLEEDLADLVVAERYLTRPEEAWRRVKGLNRLPPRALGAVVELAAWRERAAQARDLPRGWLLKDEVLTAVAVAAPREVADLEQVRGLPPKTAERHGGALVEACARGRDTPPPTLTEDEPLGAEWVPLRDLLDALLRSRAAALGLEPASLCGRRDLERLIQGERGLRVLRGWRRHAVGADLVAVVDGEATVGNAGGRLQVRRD